MSLFEFLFGCRHKRLSFPQSQRKGAAVKVAQITGTYVVCLDCGKEFPYDWTKMAIVHDGKRLRIIKSELRRAKTAELKQMPERTVRVR